MSDVPRRPLHTLPPEELAALRAAFGVGPDNLPLSLTPEERKAALQPEKPIPLTAEERRKALESGYYNQQRPPMETKPLISMKLAAAAAAVAGVLAFAASAVPSFSFIPGWVGFGLWVLASIAALLAGVALPGFKGGNPVVPATLVPAFLGASGGLATLASTMSPGTLQSVVLFLAVVCAALAGKAMPQPLKAANDNTETASVKAA